MNTPVIERLAQLPGPPLPPNPLVVTLDWLAEAQASRLQPNPNAMTLATSTPDGRPSARVVLCKDIMPQPGYVTFYTNYHSRKGEELAANPRAAVVFHWDALGRQVRIEGPVSRVPAADSDAYFASRGRESRVGAWTSAQSRPLDSRATLLTQLAQQTQRFAAETHVPRPPHWGGLRLWAEAVELWVDGEARIHDRARWTRELRADGADGFTPGPWSVTRLYP